MSRDPSRKPYFNRDPRNRDRDRDWNRSDYRRPPDRRSRSPHRDLDKRRSRSPRKNDKDVIDDNILSEISKLPEPSELWDSQFQEGGYSAAPPPPSFPQEPVTNASYASNYQPSYSGIYDDFPPVASVPTPHPPDISTWNQMSLPPPPTQAAPPFVPNAEDQLKKEAAIESEMRHQKAALSKQREDYMKKAGILKKELDTLKDQRNELRGDSKRSPSPDTKRFLKENTKLQLEIQNKLKTINNVVDMLNGIIGEEAQEIRHDSEESPERSSKSRKSRSPSASQKFNYVYYDPEMHWCRVCNEFPPTAKDYLNHLHSPAHHKMAAAHLEAPWHSMTGLNEGFPNFASAPTKRTPIKGLQFFVPSTAWYCKLCDQFIGDLHCASAHLKSVTHSKNYTNFVEQNPHWETDWMSDRQKSFEKARATAKTKPPPPPPAPEEKPGYTSHTITFNKDGFHTKTKESPPKAEEKKKKKERKRKSKKKKSSSSSSSSNSSSSDSEPVKKKKKKKEKKNDTDEKTLTEWMSALQTDRLNESDRKLLDTLKSRIRNESKREEKASSPDRIRENLKKIRESELRNSRTREARDRDRERDRERERERDRERDRHEESRHRERVDDRRDDRRHDRTRSASPRTEPKKPDIKKMPFIGKMPVYKSLGKTKVDDQKKEEEKKKEDDEATKKRREEMDAEIQKKVAEFKEKIAKAQLDRQQQAIDLGPPAVAMPTSLGSTVPAVPASAFLPPPVVPAAPPAQPPPPAAAQPPALPKDFQDALDIIFPSDVKPDMSQTDLFGGMAGMGFPMGLGGVMPPFPPFLQPQMPQMPQMMMGFDMNNSVFPTRPELYDTHVPMLPSPKIRPNKNNWQNKNSRNQKYQNQNQNNHNKVNQDNKHHHNQKKELSAKQVKENGEAAKKKEEMDDLAMLGIDASDVGAGM